MTDKELLELAAKAAFIHLDYWNDGSEPYSSGEGFILPSNAIWNPLTDDGDALRLAVKLNISPYFSSQGRIGIYRLHDDGKHRDIPGIDGCWFGDQHHELQPCVSTKEEATRRAIVRAAAEVGKAMP